ncbi:MAG TPA: penicillin-binding protein 2 [bacterium]|nr:penicillin-binding protein 2 [bacterium]
MPLELSTERRTHFEGRYVFCYLVILLFFSAATARLFYLQVVRGRNFLAFSAVHTMKEIRMPASRGVIFDRNRRPIAQNRPSFDLSVVPQEIVDIEGVKKTLRTFAQVDPELVEQKWAKNKKSPSYFPIPVASDIPYDTAVRIRTAKSLEPDASDPEGGFDFRGVEVGARPLRSYPQGPIAAATLGYIGEISEKELARVKKDQPGRYVLGDLVGASGLERTWEWLLKGRDGYQQKIVDAVGREVQNEDLASLLTEEESVHGSNLILTLDSRLQKFAEDRFEGKSGALVALDPNDGEILAMVSVPSYDPGELVANVSHNYWAKLVTDPGNLLLNRATQGAYPPGSTFKLVTALAALEEGIIGPNDRIGCSGGLKYGKRFFKCWNKGGHGAISVERAIAESCDTFFYQMGLKLGVDRLAKYANLFGLGLRTGIDLEGEKPGLIPTAEWKKRVFKQDWQPGENISISVGQGYDTATPLQNALMVSEMATGRKIVPHLLKAVEGADGLMERPPLPGEGEPLPVSPKNLEIVRKGMLGAVQSPGGTAHRLASKTFQMAGKTGTAQVISEEGKARARGINTEDHAWFVAYAPVEGPRIAVAAIVEHGGFGASAAAPIVRDVIEKYLDFQGLLPKKEEKQAAPKKGKRRVR